MRTLLVGALSAALLVCLFAALAHAQPAPDPALLAEIMEIKAFDNHAHPWRAVNEGEVDNEWDALIPDALEDQPLPFRLRPDNAEYIAAWHALYGYKYADMSAAHLAELRAAKLRVARAQGDKYPAWVLDQLNIETMNANRVAMGRGLAAPRYLWVSYVDAFLFPLSNEAAKRQTPDFRAFYPPEERLLKRYLADLHINALPATLDDYLSKVVTPTLERQRRDGAIAVKFEAAYLRTLAFADPPAEAARHVYTQYVQGGEPAADEYRALQDYIFRHIAREAGRLGLAVHFHTGAGVGGYFNVNGSNPLLLEPLFNDPTLRKTNFVLIHGGWPFARQTPALFTKPNVYADFSAQTFLLYPRDLSATIRAWLELVPEKVLFGTDAFALTPEVGWEEVGWLTNQTARQALALALTGMLQDGEITRARASVLAHMVLHDNAARLYEKR
jgi:hypothetical protein